MKKRAVLILSTLLVVAAAMFPMSGAGAGIQSQSPSVTAAPPEPIPDMYNLLNYPYEVSIEELEEPNRTEVISNLMVRPETLALMDEMKGKGFAFDEAYLLANADAMEMRINTSPTEGVYLVGLTATMVANDLMGAVTAMACVDAGCDEGFYQAHFTNLDPLLATVPDPPIDYNGMPYFFITTLRWVGGRIVYWRYWWFDSHHHPNWYYAHYFWYWRYWNWYWYASGLYPWPYWYWWAHGWYYWRYWYFWSTWFPWQQPLAPVPLSQ